MSPAELMTVSLRLWQLRDSGLLAPLALEGVRRPPTQRVTYYHVPGDLPTGYPAPSMSRAVDIHIQSTLWILIGDCSLGTPEKKPRGALNETLGRALDST